MKKELRVKCINKRKDIKDRKLKDQIILDSIKKVIAKYNKIMIYYPISSEVDILDIVNNSSNDKKFYLPYCKNNNIEIRYLDNIDDLIKDEVNIWSSKVVTNDEIEVVIAPAVASNKKFYRLGYGGGYYDRFLKNRNVFKIVVTYDELLLDDDFQESFDIKFDCIITDKRILGGENNV